MDGYESLGVPYMPHIAPEQEVVTWQRRKKSMSSSSAPGASGSVYAAVLAKAGKKVVVMDNGPDWQTSDLISSDIWGRRIKPAGAPFILEGKHPVSMGAQGGWGVGGAALHYFANFPRLLPNDFRIKSEHGRAHDWPISYDDVAPWYDKVAAGDRRVRRRQGRGAVAAEGPALSDAADEDLQERARSGSRASRPTASAWCRPRSA